MTKSTLLHHKGYYGSIEPSLNEATLKGKVLFIEDTISYSAPTISELQTAFASVIDLYLQECVTTGKLPIRPFKGQFNVRVAPQLHQTAALRAQAEGTSLNRIVARALETYLQEHLPQPQPQAV